jgi:TolA-binding protein
MKSAERHHLKQNEFAETTLRVADYVSTNRSRVLAIVAAIVVVVAVVAGFMAWRKSQADQAGALLGVALSVAQSPIAPAPSLPGASQQAGTFPTEQARTDATLKALNDVVAQYPNTDAGVAASYHAGATLLAAARFDEAEQHFAKVVDAGHDLYSPLARLGRAEALMGKGQFDAASAIYSEVAAQAQDLPADGVLMKLAQAYGKAGKSQEARATYQRIVDEFPDSPYATSARQQLGTSN